MVFWNFDTFGLLTIRFASQVHKLITKGNCLRYTPNDNVYETFNRMRRRKVHETTYLRKYASIPVFEKLKIFENVSPSTLVRYKEMTKC